MSYITKEGDGLIEEYITNIYDTNQSKGIYNGKEIDCKSVSGAMLLAKQLIYNEKLFREGDPNKLPAIELPRRETFGYVGHGAFGIVFVKRVGRPGKSENLFACKIIESEDIDTKLYNEVYYQKLAAKENIAPLVYDYYLYKCDDGKSRGVIIMEYLNNYIKGYEFNAKYEELDKYYKSHNSQSPVPTIFRAVSKNLNLLESKLKELKINLPDFQTNFMINTQTYDVKAVDFGMAQPIQETMEYGGMSKKTIRKKKSRKLNKKSKKKKKSRKMKKCRKSNKKSIRKKSMR